VAALSVFGYSSTGILDSKDAVAVDAYLRVFCMSDPLLVESLSRAYHT
jgi:hypothetical protein